VRIRPRADYYAVKITIAESSIYAITRRSAAKAGPADFGRRLLGRVRSRRCCYLGAAITVRRSAERRLMLAEMAPITRSLRSVGNTDRAGAGPASASGRDWLTTDSAAREIVADTPFNVTGGSCARAMPWGSRRRLPLSLQIVGPVHSTRPTVAARPHARDGDECEAAGPVSIRRRLFFSTDRRQSYGPSGQ